MSGNHHRLLARQLRKLDLADTQPPSAAAWVEFLALVDRTYEEEDQGRYTLERSMAIASEEMMALYQQKSSNEAHLRTIVESLKELIWLKDKNGVYLSCNPTFERFVGLRATQILGKTDAELAGLANANFLHVSKRHPPTSTQSSNYEEWLKSLDGDRLALLEIAMTPVCDANAQVIGVLGVGREITEKKQAEDKIKELAFYDSLTGLPNRTLVLDRIAQATIASARDQLYGALLFIDLDHFKMLNDTLGHDMGDRLLQQVAQRLTACVRESDTVARLGGDEFVVVLRHLSGNQLEAATQTEHLAKRMLASLNGPYELDGTTHRSTPSIGATLFKGHDTDIPNLLRQADLAMYKAKDMGRNTLCFFDPVLEDVVLERVQLEQDLRLALSDHQFCPYYQPQVDEQGRIQGVEFLTRWKHPQRGMVSPAEFIPLAEDTHLIIPLGQWVLEQACRQLAAWAQKPQFAHLTMAINISSRQFREPDFADKVLDALRRTGASPQLLKLELTESLLISEVEEVIGKMQKIKAWGVGFSLDDFGTGYSSLSYLKRLPLEQLKIDQSFVRDMLSDSHDASIVKTIIALAQNLGLSVMAEGVEEESQRRLLVRMGCHLHQGYLYGRPVPIDQFEKQAMQQSVLNCS